MSVKISQQQHDLKKQQTDNPNPGPAAKPGQHDFSQQGLHLEQEEGARKNREPVNVLGTLAEADTHAWRISRFQIRPMDNIQRTAAESQAPRQQCHLAFGLFILNSGKGPL